MEKVTSIQKVDRKFNTGDEPLLVECSDGIKRICKYNRNPLTPANKLVCEFVGALLIEQWNLNSPKFDFVYIKSNHIPEGFQKICFDSPCFGTKLIENTYDINFNNYFNIPKTEQNFIQLLKIALFDFWVSNEDRSANNSNLLFDYQSNLIIPIDNGGIFNTINLDYQISLLDSFDSILTAEIFTHLKHEPIIHYLEMLSNYFKASVQKSTQIKQLILNSIPGEWNIPASKVDKKLDEIFNEKWIQDVWNKFTNTLNSSL